MPHFVQDVEEIRARAIKKIEEGPVTSTYGLELERAVGILNEALATEIVCVLRYQHHYFMATGVHGRMAAEEFKEHADEEREHADRIAERIQQLGGKPDFNPKTLLERSVAHYIEGETLADMIREDLIAERVVIDVYRDMIKYFGDNDPTTRIMIEDILGDEEEHASDLSDLLYVVNPSTGETEMQDPGTKIGAQEGGRGKNKAIPQSWDDEESASAMRKENQSAREQQSRKADQSRQDVENIGEAQRGRSQENRRSRPQIVDATEQHGGPQARSQAVNPGGNNKNDRTMGVQPSFEQREGGGRRDRAESRPARSTGQERPGASRRNDIPPAHEPGTTGRVMARRGRNNIAPAEDDIAIGGQTGTNRSPKVTNKNRKNRAA